MCFSKVNTWSRNRWSDWLVNKAITACHDIFMFTTSLNDASGAFWTVNANCSKHPRTGLTSCENGKILKNENFQIILLKAQLLMKCQQMPRERNAVAKKLQDKIKKY